MTILGGWDDGGDVVHYEYEGFYPGSVPHRISQADPEGGDHEPAEADYAAFDSWVTATYEAEALAAYLGVGRDPEAG